MKVRYLILFLLLNFNFSLSYASIDRLEVNQLFTLDDGLSHSHITCLFSDSEGFLWVGTRDGLNVFDGYEFKLFRVDPVDSNSILNNYIYSIAEDSKGNIWVGTKKGLSIYDKSKTHINNITLTYDNKPNEVYSVYIDDKDIVWCKTYRSLVKIEISSDGNYDMTWFDHYNDAFSYAYKNKAYKIFEDSRNMLWVATKDGLNYFDRDLELFQRFYNDRKTKNSISNNKINDIFEDSEDNLWIATNKGLNKFRRKTKDFQVYKYQGKSELWNIIEAIFKDDEGNLYAANYYGISKINRNAGTIEKTIPCYFQKRPYDLRQVNTIVVDKSNILWIATANGLFKCDLKPNKFNTLYFGKEDNVNYNSITSILDDSNHLWIGSSGIGLVKINKEDNSKVKRFYNESNFLGRKIQNNNVYSIFKDESHNIWLGMSEGVDIKTKNSDGFVNVKDLYSDFESDIFHRNKFYAFEQVDDGLVWVGAERGIHKFNRKKKSIKSIYNLYYEDVRVDIKSVNDLHYSQDSLLWIASSGGLFAYNEKKGKLKRYLISSISNSNSNIIYTIREKDNFIYVGAFYGLYKFNKESGGFIKVLDDQGRGFQNTKIVSMEIFKDNIWMGTPVGLMNYSLKKRVYVTYDKQDGLQGYEFIKNSSEIGDSGTLYFGGLNGVNYFMPDSMINNTYSPVVKVTGCEFFAENELKKLPIIDNKIIVPKNTKFFTLYFSALDFTNLDKNQYKYQLNSTSNPDKKWISVGNKRSATFTNLFPGKYNFRVIGSNNDGIWSSDYESVEIVVRAPFYRTKFAFYLYGIIVIFLIYLFIYFRTRRLKISNRILKEKEIASKEIEKKSKELAIKNKDITDSLNYAKRIQQAMIPSTDILRRNFEDSFVLYKPKTIVSGDFYWLSETESKIVVAAVDCTGHGVPGAFMSLIGLDLFRRVANQEKMTNPGDMLNQINLYYRRMVSDNSGYSIKDGMDLSLIVIDKLNMELQFSGAFNPLVIVRDNHIEEFKADRMSIGLEININDVSGFTNNIVKIKEGDVIYLFTDGFADQFGGTQGKKFKKRRLRHLFLNIHKYNMQKQKEYLDESFESWRGNLDQVDDVLIIGIKI